MTSKAFCFKVIRARDGVQYGALVLVPCSEISSVEEMAVTIDQMGSRVITKAGRIYEVSMDFRELYKFWTMSHFEVMSYQEEFNRVHNGNQNQPVIVPPTTPNDPR